MLDAPKTIIISGTGRNVGKTTYAMQLIKKYSAEHPIAIKISSHSHNQTQNIIPIMVNADFGIWEQTMVSDYKDSSKMLKAGASKVFYIEAKDAFLPQVLDILTTIIDFNNRIIIESAAIRRYLQPEQFILVYSNEYSETKEHNKDIEKYITSRINFQIS